MKRIPELRDLSDDHHTGLVLALRCKRASQPKYGLDVDAVWAQVAEAFELHLEPHFRIEEEHLLPALDAIGETGLAERIRSDHDELRASAASAVDVTRFGELLEAHIRFEERQVFEATQKRLPETSLRAIATACSETSRVCPSLFD